MGKKDGKEDKKPFSKYARFSTLGVQMGVIIAFFTWLGTYLDDKYDTTTAWWTLGLSLFGVMTSLYIMIKEVINLNKDEE